MQHFLDIRDHTEEVLQLMIERGVSLKKNRQTVDLQGNTVACVFDEPSTRTRVSFFVAIQELGGQALMLDGDSMQLKEGESLEDTARVMSRYVDAIVIRSLDHGKVKRLAEYSSIPVINALTKLSHPCQVMADIMTLKEKRGCVEGLSCLWIGAINNMTNSWIDAACRFRFYLRICCPQGLAGLEDVEHRMGEGNSYVSVEHDPLKAVEGVDVVITDTWSSLGDEAEKERLRSKFSGYTVDKNLMGRAGEGALFMHCLPAYRGFEVSDEVIDGDQSVVWDEAENRLHVQKAILLYCMDKL